MTDAETRAWLEALAPTDEARIVLLKDMLRHAAGDGMSAEDRVLCVQCLKQLELKLYGPKPPRRSPFSRVGSASQGTVPNLASRLAQAGASRPAPDATSREDRCPDGAQVESAAS